MIEREMFAGRTIGKMNSNLSSNLSSNVNSSGFHEALRSTLLGAGCLLAVTLAGCVSGADATDDPAAAGATTEARESLLTPLPVPGPVPEPQRCGGPLGLQCGKGAFCSTPAGTCPGPKQLGLCRPRPQACTDLYDPVCGCDGKTYSNACFANAVGTSVASRGECPKPGACVSNRDCAPDSFCDKPVGQCAAGGTCTVRPQICIQIYRPVCGCDGRTYSNSCVAASAGASVASAGECPVKQFCGGIAGIPCPGAGICVDDPSDDCDPKQGGADCGGMCVCRQTQLCVRGSHFDPAPSVCACVADPPPACGPVTCPAGQVCCNASCGICTPPGRVCIQIAC